MIAQAASFFSFVQGVHAALPLDVRLCVSASFGLFLVFGVLRMIRR